MKFLCLAAMALTCLVIPGSNFAIAEPQQPEPATPLQPLMQMKLERSKAILEGLALEDYEAVATNARALGVLSLESGWNVIQTEEYDRQSHDFRRAAGMIAESASAQNISRATLGYVELTVRCVECHTYMRDHRAEIIESSRD